ncbi:MAG: PAS domain-containing protein, partial [Polaribacter sp.]|nr:PAS domain-containing protein [Polaribacter sp.]
MKIRTKFQVAFMLLFIILAVSIASVIYFTLLSHFEEVEGNRLNERVRSTARAVDNFMLTRVADFNVLSNNPLFSSSSSEVSSQYLTRVVNQYPYYNNLFFANKEGVILSSSNQKFIGENILQFDPDIQNGINKTLSGGHEDVYISELSIATQKEITRNQPLDLKFFSDVIDLEGNVVGVLVGFMNMKPLNDLILYTDKISVGNKHTYLVNNKGVVFVSGNKEVEIFKQHPDLLINELQKKIEGGERGFYFNQNAKGLKLLSGYVALSKYGTDGVDNWFLLRTVPFNEIMKPFFKTVYIVVFILLLIISLIAIFLFYSYTKRVKNSLALAEKREFSLKEASKVAKIGFQEYDIASNTFTWSDYVYHIFGFDPKDGMPSLEKIISVFDDVSKEKIGKAAKAIDFEGIPCDIELKLINQRNEELWVRYVAHAVYNDQNKIVGRRGVLQNITEAKNAQLELELSKQKVQASLELLEKSEKSKNEASKTAKIGFVEDDIATETYTWSEYVFQIFGFDSNFPTPSAKEIEALFEEESLKILKKSSLELDKFGVSYDVELKLKNLRNEDTWIRLVVQPVYNKQNEIVKRRGVLQDITAAKTAQFELELSKEKIQKTLALLEKTNFSMDEASKVANIGYWEQDLVTNTFVWSDNIYQIFELNPKNGMPSQKGIMERFDKVSQEKLLQASSNIISKGINYDVELKFKDQKNKEIWIRRVGQPIYNQQNKIIGLRGVIQDITASKKAQLELELSKQKIQASLELLEKSEYSKNEGTKIAKIGYWEHNLITDTVVWSDYLYQVFEANPENGVPLQNELMEKFDKESQVKLTQATLDIISKGINYDIELKFINLKNEDVWLRIVAQPIYNQQQKIVGKRGVMQNITAAKKIQLELESSKEKIETSLHLLEISEFAKNETSKIAKIGHWEYSIITDTFIWSDYIYEVYGFGLTDKIPSRNEIIKLYDQPSQQILEQATLELDSKGIPYDVEMKLINRNNEEIWVRNVVQLVYNQQNEVIGRRGVLHNITASKIAQLELELSKQKIQTSLYLLEISEFAKNETSRIAKIGHWEYSLITDTFKWSDYIYEVYGFGLTDKIPSRNEIIKLYDQPSQQILEQATLELDSKGIPYDVEMKLINRNNEEIWVRNVVQLVYNQQNEVIGRRGVLH